MVLSSGSSSWQISAGRLFFKISMHCCNSKTWSMLAFELKHAPPSACRILWLHSDYEYRKIIFTLLVHSCTTYYLILNHFDEGFMLRPLGTIMSSNIYLKKLFSDICVIIIYMGYILNQGVFLQPFSSKSIIQKLISGWSAFRKF